MQNSQSVQILNNPLKIIKGKGQINKDNEIIHFNLVPAYLQLNRGVWNMSLDTFCFKVIGPSQLQTVYEISSSLCTCLQLGENLMPISGLATLGHMFALCEKNTFMFGEFERKWFTVDNPNSTFFDVICKPIDMTKQVDADIQLELTILFQRQV